MYDRKNTLKEKAKKHVEKCYSIYGDAIKHAIDNTYIRDCSVSNTSIPDVMKEKYSSNIQIIIEDADTVSSLYRHHDDEEKTALLNFASYKFPGGGFLEGARAQEECLCHESILYNVLQYYEMGYYDLNRKNTNKSLYRNKCLYSEDILFLKGDKQLYANVISCAAPNKYAAKKYSNVSESVASDVLKSRIKFVLDTAAVYDNRTLILGAYGCGVFGNNATEVASIFKYYLTGEYNHAFKKVVFAIPAGENLSKFIEVFNAG